MKSMKEKRSKTKNEKRKTKWTNIFNNNFSFVLYPPPVQVQMEDSYEVRAVQCQITEYYSKWMFRRSESIETHWKMGIVMEDGSVWQPNHSEQNKRNFYRAHAMKINKNNFFPFPFPFMKKHPKVVVLTYKRHFLLSRGIEIILLQSKIDRNGKTLSGKAENTPIARLVSFFFLGNFLHIFRVFIGTHKHVQCPFAKLRTKM